MTCPNECPICMDEIQAANINCVTTECGHQFHASCLLKNVAHNGFGCPYCRTALAEDPEEDEDDDDETVSEFSDEELDLYDDYSLRGMRWLFQRSLNEPLDEEEDINPNDVEEAIEDPVPRPSAAYVAERLSNQGITFEDLVKCMLYTNHEEYEDYEGYQVKESELFGKFRILISNYNPEENAFMNRVNERMVAAASTTSGPTASTTPGPTVENEAQPKERVIPNRRETMNGLVDLD